LRIGEEKITENRYWELILAQLFYIQSEVFYCQIPTHRHIL